MTTVNVTTTTTTPTTAAEVFPRLERGCSIEVPAPRDGRPGYRWVQGWCVVYSATRRSMETTYADAVGLLEKARAHGNKATDPATGKPLSLYARLVAAGAEVSNWQSDLYFYATPENAAILQQAAADGVVTRANVTRFKSATDGRMMYDAPFCFDPYWQRACGPVAEPSPHPKAEG